MSAMFCTPTLLFPHNTNLRFLVFIPCKTFKRKPCLLLSAQFSTISNSDDSAPLPKQSQAGYDPSQNKLRLQASSISSRDAITAEPEPRSWFGPNGQYIRELPCPSCRGRGYTPCAKCGIERSRPDCLLCKGKGMTSCPQCLGERVIWEESIDERPWEKAHSVSQFKMKEDDEVDSLDIKLDMKRKSKRVYQSPPPEVNLKISRSLKFLNAKTGLFSKRMRIIHQDPALHAQRVAAIKKVKGTTAARKHASETMKAYFSDPENRRRRSISKKGVKFHCSYCGREGHRGFYCPELKDTASDRRHHCRVCGEKGHNRRTCTKSHSVGIESPDKRDPNRRTCPKSHSVGIKSPDKRAQRCGVCHQYGHNSRTCPRFASGKQAEKNT